MQITQKQIDIIRNWAIEPRNLVEDLLPVRAKSGSSTRFLFNAAQDYYYMNAAKQNVALKGRQAGISTLQTALRLARVLTRPNWTAVSIAHLDSTTQVLFDTVRWWYKYFYDFAPKIFGSALAPVPQYSNRKELYFPSLNSRYVIYTAGNKRGVARGTTINDFHGSEVAYWPSPETIIGGAMESITKDAYIDLESTANGAGDFWHGLVLEAERQENAYNLIFIPWYVDNDYSLSRNEALTRRVKIDEPFSDDELYLMTNRGLSVEQIYWRRWKKASLKGLFKQEYPENIHEAFLTSGKNFFDLEHVDTARRAGGGVWPVEKRHNDEIFIYARPVKGVKYIIGADVAEGTDGGDYDAAYVIRADTGEDCAVIHGKFGLSEYAEMLASIGHEYNTAKLGVERNNHGHAVLNHLIHTCDYPELYKHADYDVVKMSNAAKPGFPTTSKTKPMMLAALAEFMEHSPELLHFYRFFDEAITFVRHADGIGAVVGAHDDLIMARAIAEQIRVGYSPTKKKGRLL